MINVLFVCLGNICRSPSAEGVFKALVKDEGLDEKFFIDSAGTSAYHVGEPADSRMRKHASRRNIQLTSRSRKFGRADFVKFDYIMVMDGGNYEDVISMDRSGEYQEKVFMMTEFSALYAGRDVPDPYYGGDAGFGEVLDILEDSCRGFLEEIKRDNEL
ncbi:MAG: low molecular weight phosphotyrosine protein phosphatase [Spirochaetales bacterium]|nr:low molecular weight phosphotyrosine protein phosphatase [Spirochaetales bacterium]